MSPTPLIDQPTAELKVLKLHLQQLIDYRISGGRGSDLEELRERLKLVHTELRLREQAP